MIFGGRSGEHEISLLSARGVLNAIDREKYEVIPIGITKEGTWLASSVPLEALASGDPLEALASGDPDQSNLVALLAEPSQRGLLCIEEQQEEHALRAVHLSEIEVAFPILHGPYGEDGTVQGLLELAGIPYVGAGVAASAVGMDKAIFKDVMQAHGLPIVRHLTIKRKAWDRDPDGVVERIESEIGYNCFVKPANLGSSVGISKAHNRAELVAALDDAAQYDRKLIVEVAVDAREIEVSVLGNDEQIASLPSEIVPSNEFYDYAAKYLDGESQVLLPAPLPAAVTAEVRRLSIAAFLAIDCAGMARADFLLDRQTNALYVNEVNTIPGFTPISAYPKMWEASGISYTELIDRLIQLAIERHADKSRSATSYQPVERS
ncbi:MAG TPA: D-alanine--D-alanine ligase family protein [Anaerolineae bacterium]|nr:D-alanine--D-alanine ligase family protein [Anaerolineae bacterium]